MKFRSVALSVPSAARRPAIHARVGYLAGVAALLFGLSVAVTSAFASSSAAAPDAKNVRDVREIKGTVVAIGGALKADNREVWGRLVTLSGGNGAKWVVLPTASGEPEAAARQTIETLKTFGAVGEMIPLSDRIKSTSVDAVVRDAVWLRKVDEATGVYFTGGAQERITKALYTVDGKHTPLLDAIWRLYRRGGVVAGSSAGAAIMSETMFREPPDILTVMRQGAARGSEIDRGLGFVAGGVFVDQHFLKRGRLGRLVAVMAQEGIKLGLGVEENSAAVITGSQVESIGAKGVLLVDLTNATRVVARPVHIRGAELTWLDHGDQINLSTGALKISAAKQAGKVLDAGQPDFKPYYRTTRFYADFLGDGTLLNAMAELVDSAATETRGLAFTPSAGVVSSGANSGTNLGFEFRLFKNPQTRGYYASASGGEDYTVSKMGLDVVPVQMATPLYQPASDNKTASAKAGENGGLLKTSPTLETSR
jgi:cyanophycinase